MSLLQNSEYSSNINYFSKAQNFTMIDEEKY